MELKMIENILNKYVIEAPSMGRSVILADRIDEVAEDIQEHLLQQTACYTMLPPDVTLKDIKQIRNYFGEHDVSMFEHKAFAILDKLIKHLEASGGNIV